MKSLMQSTGRANVSSQSKQLDVASIVATIRSCLPSNQAPFALHEPTFAGNEWTYVKECLDTGWVSSLGTFVDRFERMLEEVTGARRAVAVVNGTAALHMCLKLAGVEPKDEVIIPTLTFVATANAVAYCGATPHLADSDERTLGLDPCKLRDHLRETTEMRSGFCCNRFTGARMSAVVPMHTFGHPVDVEGLQEVCSEFRLALVEDAAESLGSYYKGRHTGTFGITAALSFNGNKVVTTGGGGAIITNDEALGNLAKHLTTTARSPHRWSFLHDQIGYNYRLPNLNAALGCAQLEQLPSFLEEKRALARRYAEAFRSAAGVRIFAEASFAKSNYWLNALILDEPYACERDRLLEATHESGIVTRPVWTLMHRLPMYQSCPRMDLQMAESLGRRVINLPSSAVLACHA